MLLCDRQGSYSSLIFKHPRMSSRRVLYMFCPSQNNTEQHFKNFLILFLTGDIEAAGRSPISQGKAIGDSFPVDRDSKTRITGQLGEEAGLCPDHIFLIFEVRRPAQPHMHRRLLGGQTGVMFRGALPIGLFDRIHLG